jgi:hypothetical protein
MSRVSGRLAGGLRFRRIIIHAAPPTTSSAPLIAEKQQAKTITDQFWVIHGYSLKMRQRQTLCSTSTAQHAADSRRHAPTTAIDSAG